MIGRLQGIVVALHSDSVVVDVHGVGYEVFISSSHAAALSLELPVVLNIETHVREDHIHLYGFPSKAHQEWFRTLNKVTGVGAKMALAVRGHLRLAQLEQALLHKEQHMLRAIPGVGPKLADRLILELQGKVVEVAKHTPPVLGNASSSVGDAVAALLQLGYSRNEAQQAAMQALPELGAGGSADLIKLALGKLMQQEAL